MEPRKPTSLSATKREVAAAKIKAAADRRLRGDITPEAFDKEVQAYKATKPKHKRLPPQV